MEMLAITAKRLTAFFIFLFLSSVCYSQNNCEHKNIVQITSSAYSFVTNGEHPLSEEGEVPYIFRGRLLRKNCNNEFCSLGFSVIEVLFDDTREWMHSAGVDIPEYTGINTGGKIAFLPIDSLTIGSEWLVKIQGRPIQGTSNKPLHGEDSSAFLQCGEWMAKIIDENVIFNSEKSSIGYSNLRKTILTPLTNDGGAAYTEWSYKRNRAFCAKILDGIKCSSIRNPLIPKVCEKECKSGS